MKTNNTVSTSSAILATVAVNLGLLLVLVGTCLPLVRLLAGQPAPWMRYVYAAGAVLCLCGRFVTARREAPNTRVKRLWRLEMWVPVIFCVGAFFLFWPGAGATDWLAFTLAGGVIQGYVSLMLPRAMRKG